MLFNSYEFIFGFLPLTLAAYCFLGQMVSPRAALLWLTTASLFFYGWWDPAYLVLLTASILFNFSIGFLLTRAAQESRPSRRPLLVFGVMANLGLLGYYKYSEFFSVNLEALTALATYSSPVFAAAADGAPLSALEAWTGVLAYTLQLYFDFSGYSDMAVGLSWMFGIILPFNFNSPYKAVNIIDFWRRWHMSLSAFLRTYLYFSLGGNRLGKLRRYINLFLYYAAGWSVARRGLDLRRVGGSTRRLLGR